MQSQLEKEFLTMPTKKKASPSRRQTARRSSPASKRLKPKSGGVSAMASAPLKQLRKTVNELKTRLAKEAKASSTSSKLVAEARKARETVLGQVKALRDQGARLSKELKKALGDTNRHKVGREQALAKIAELRAELGRRTQEVKSKSEELAKLAMDSAGRAKNIIMSHSSSSEAVGGISPVTETESITEETKREEESPRESSIEREVHPERKNEPNY
jgi:seryl-tRNA synthetase